MARTRVIGDTSLIPMEVSTKCNVHTDSCRDNRDSFLNAKIDAETERATEREDAIQEQVDQLREKGFAVRDVVQTHSDLDHYDPGSLLRDDIIVVLDDGGYSTYYRWDGNQFSSVGSSSYTTDRVDEMVNDLRSQLQYLGKRGSLRDIVQTHADLDSYDTSTLVEGDMLAVLVDEAEGYAATYYRKGADGTMSLYGSMGPNYYNKRELDERFGKIDATLDNHEVRITANRTELDMRATEEESYNILVGA